MNFRNILGIPCLVLIFLIGIPSCECDEFRVIKNIDKAAFFDPATNRVVQDQEFLGDTLGFQVSFDIESFASQYKFSGTMSSAWALSRECNLPLANEIVAVDITSDRSFNDIAAGESLGAVMLGATEREFGYESIDEVLLEFGRNRLPFNLLRDIFLVLTEKPDTPDHVFTLRIQDDSNHIFTFEMPMISWK